METTVNGFLVSPRDAWPGPSIASLPVGEEMPRGIHMGPDVNVAC